MDIGKRIKERRKALGMSVEDLARAIGKSRATVYRYENGYIESLPTEALVPVIDALQTSPDYLIGWTDDPTPRLKVEKEPDKDKVELMDLYSGLVIEYKEKLMDRAKELSRLQRYQDLIDRKE